MNLRDAAIGSVLSSGSASWELGRMLFRTKMSLLYFLLFTILPTSDDEDLPGGSGSSARLPPSPQGLSALVVSLNPLFKQ